MTTDPQTARRARIVAAIKSSPFEELRTVDHAPNGPLQITAKVDDLAAAVLAVLPAADRAAEVADAIRTFPFDNFGMDDVSFALEDDPEAQEWVPALADAVLATLPATTAQAVELRDYWHGEAMSATTRIIELEGQLEESRRAAAEPATDRAGLREQIAEALYRHSHPGWATRYADLDRDERDTYLGRADAVLPLLPAFADRAAEEAYRLAVSAALRLGTGATWEAIRDRAEDLTAEVEQLTETSRRLLEQRQEMAAERFAWQERGDRAEARVRQLEAAAPVDRATVEEHRLALSDALGLGTGAPWDAIRDRVTELALPPLGQDPVARRLGLVAEHRATVLNEAADALDGLTQETAAADMTMPEGRWRAGLDAGIRELRRLADEERDEWEAQTHLDQLVEDVCRPVVLGGEIVRVHGAAEMSDESRAALAEVTAIVKRRMADEAQQQTETPACPDPIECGHEAALGQAQQEVRRLGLMVDEYGHGASTLSEKLKGVRDAVAFAERVVATSGPGPASAVQAVIDRLRAALDPQPAVVPAGAGEEPADETLTTQELAHAIDNSTPYPVELDSALCRHMAGQLLEMVIVHKRPEHAVWQPEEPPGPSPEPMDPAVLATDEDCLRCPRCREDITNYFEDDHVFRTGDDRPYCSGECVIAAHRKNLPTTPAEPVQHAPGIATLCADCRAKGRTVCMDDVASQPKEA